MISRRHRRWIFGLMPLLWSGSLIAQNQMAEPSDEQEEVIERILALRQELEMLLQDLDPELRQEVERRYREMIEGISEPPPAPTVPDLKAPEIPVSEPPVQAEPLPVLPPETVPQPAPPAPEEGPVSDREPTVVERLFEDQEPPVDPATLPRGCGTLAVLDTNEDGLLSGADRYWRYLRLWFDTGDGIIDDDEIETLLERDIRSIDTGLSYYQLPEKVTGDVRTDDLIRFGLLGKQAAGIGSPALIIQAGRLSRGGEVILIDDDGLPLSGFQALGSSTRIELADGTVQPLFCP